MPGALIRSISKTPGNGLYPIAQRGLHRLSDGNLVAVYLDSNWNGLVGDGGDNTNIAKIYVYTSANGETWTLRATVTTDLNGTDPTEYSSCVDALNNVHLVWKSHAGNMGYVKLTYTAGPSYAVGTTRTAYTKDPNFNTSRVDIDSLGNSTDDVIFAVTTWKSGQTVVKVFHTNGGGATIHTTNTITLGGNPRTDSDYISIAGCKDAIVSNVATFTLMINQAFSKDLGERVQIIQINTSTGAQIASNPTFTLPTAGKANGMRLHTIIIPDWAPRTAFVTGVYGDGSTTTGGTMAAWKYSIAAGGVARTDIIPYQTKKMPNGSRPWPSAGWRFGTGGMDSDGHCLLYLISNNYAYSCSVDLSGTVAKWRNVPYAFDQLGYVITGGAISTVIAGGSRNLTKSTMGCLVVYGHKMFQLRYLGLQIPPAPKNISPANAQTVTTDRPVFSAQFNENFNQPQVDQHIKWQVASDSGFTTNLRTITDDTNFRPLNVHTGGAVVVTTEQIDALQEMFQGLWYVRAYEVDEIGNQSVATDTQTFTISHPPVGANLAPNSGAVAIYGAGTVQMQWTFTDPSPFDFQTAYEIFVLDVDANIIYDSGKISSMLPTGVANIPLVNKDQVLLWYVVLWDSDDVEGPASSVQSFIVSDKPDVVILDPTADEVLSALPNITWDPGISAAKVQSSWRVLIKQAGISILDTGYVADSITTSFQVPNGVMHNGNAYTIEVHVVDNLGLEGQATVSVTTAWTAPNAPETRIYQYEFDRLGFIFVGWDSTQQDVNFIQWNVYRREVGDLSWTLLESVVQGIPTYGYRDYGAKANTTYQYVVTQVSNATGDLVESTHDSYVQIKTSASRYWLLDPFGVLDAVPLYQASAEDYTDERESAIFNVMGRGRHRDVGDYLGPNGNLTIQMRDKYVGLDAAENLFLDPAMQMHTVGNILDQWTISSSGTAGNISNDYQTFYEPAPDHKLLNAVFRADAWTGSVSDWILLIQSIDSVRTAEVMATSDKKFRVAWWMAPESDPANTGVISLEATVDYKDVSLSIISSETNALTQVDTYEPTISGDVNTGNWKRVSAQFTAPAGTVTMTFGLRIRSSAAGQNGVILGGGSMIVGTTDKPYFDGDFRGALWDADQFTSKSVSLGSYTARKQRQDIYEMRLVGHSAYVRNPFGDVWTISLDDPKFSRLAGTGGEAELGDLTLPYVTVVGQ